MDNSAIGLFCFIIPIVLYLFVLVIMLCWMIVCGSGCLGDNDERNTTYDDGIGDLNNDMDLKVISTKRHKSVPFENSLKDSTNDNNVGETEMNSLKTSNNSHDVENCVKMLEVKIEVDGRSCPF